MRVLVFGASITQGFHDTRGGWVGRLWEYYTKQHDEHGMMFPPAVFNLGISGDRTKQVLTRFDQEVEARLWPGDELAFVFSIGTNNAAVKGKDRNLSEPEQYRQDLVELVAKARKYSDKIMFVGLPGCDEARTTPVSWVDVSYTNVRLWLFEQVMREFCAGESLPHVPVFEPTKARPELFADGLHPNDNGHRLIFELVQPELEKLLQ